MVDYLPFEIQTEIIKTLPIKSVFRFKAVSKQWKSFIQSADFFANYHFQPQDRLLVRYTDPEDMYKLKYVSIVDDDTFPEHKSHLTVPVPDNLPEKPTLIGSSQGLFCLYYSDGKLTDSEKMTAVIWNPTIAKSVAIDVPHVFDIDETVIGFGVCPQTSDPKLVKIIDTSHSLKWQVEVFTLSSGVWRSPHKNLPNESIMFTSNQVNVDGFIYWLSYDTSQSSKHWLSLIMSFDMTTDEFTEVSLHHLADNTDNDLTIFKLRDSLALLDYNYEGPVPYNSVWMRDKSSCEVSFTKLYMIAAPKQSIYASLAPEALIRSILGFRKSGKPIIEMVTSSQVCKDDALFGYKHRLIRRHVDPHYVKVYGESSSFFASSYTETLLLLDQ